MTYEERDWPRAAPRARDRGRPRRPNNDVLFYNLGLIYRRNGLLEEALAAFRRSDAINPREIASATKPRAAERAAEVEAEIAARDRLIAELAASEDLAGLERGSPEWRRAMSQRLAAQNRPTWARGVLRAP